MHRLIDPIFRKHEQWLKDGGEQALDVVKTSNLMAFVSEGLEEAEAAGERSGYERGRKEGIELGRRKEREAYEKREENK